MSACDNSTRSIATSASPGRNSTPNRCPIIGFRRSRSTRATRWPPLASATARFEIVVVFPSSPTQLVTMITLALTSRFANSTLDRRRRTASASTSEGSSSIARPARRGVGSLASNGVCNVRWISSSSLTRLSRASHRNSVARPTRRPNARASTPLRIGVGATCVPSFAILTTSARACSNSIVRSSWAFCARSP